MEIQEAKIISEKIIEKPMEIEPVAEITGTQKITNNIKDVHEYAVKLKEYYSTKIVTEDTLKDYKNEKANINKIKDKITDYRKAIVKEYNKPIAEFETIAKMAESTLKEAYECLNEQCNQFDIQKKQEKIEECKRYFNEVCQQKNISFVTYEKMNQNVTLSKTYKELYSEIDVFIENIDKDITTIETMEDREEILIDYMKSLNLSSSIKSVQERKKAKELIQNNVKEEKIVEPEVQETKLNAPIIEEELVECSFKVTTSLTKIKALVEYMKEEGITYESIK